MTEKLNYKLFLGAFFVALLLLVPYELYWRYVEKWPAGHDLENLDYWADWRGKVDELGKDDVIIMGSSRGHFDINIHLWDSITGTRPIMLAYPGSSPFHPLADLVENTEFNGLLVMSVAPGLFFTVKDSWGAGRGKAFVDHYYNRTYAQRFSHWIYQYIDPQFSYIQEELRLRNLINRLPFENRDSVWHPDIWPPMVHMDEYRNIRMLHGMETDTVIQNRQTAIWTPPVWKNRYKDSVDVIMDHYVKMVKKLKDRGARVVFIRPPVTGGYLENEPRLFPREAYWDRLLRETDCPGYHFMDHPDTKGMIPPEWSHLNRKDADLYTKTIIHQLRQDQIL